MLGDYVNRCVEYCRGLASGPVPPREPASRISLDTWIRAVLIAAGTGEAIQVLGDGVLAHPVIQVDGRSVAAVNDTRACLGVATAFEEMCRLGCVAHVEGATFRLSQAGLSAAWRLS